MKAKARLLYPSISVSERVSGLGVKGALLFTWLLAHCDHQGRYAGSAKKLKIEIVPMIDEITQNDVESALSDMESAGLILRYRSAQHGPLLQIADWWEFQTGLKLHHPSRYPPPEGWKDRITELPRDSSGKFTAKDASSDKALEDKLLALLEEGVWDVADLAEQLGCTKAELNDLLTWLWKRERIQVFSENGPSEPPFGDGLFVTKA